MIGLLRLEGWIMMKTSVDVETMKQIKIKDHKLCNDNVHNNSNSFRQSDVNL